MNKIFITAKALLFTLFVTTGVLASPVITSGSDLFQSGQTFVISGAGFGEKSNAAPMIFDNFDDGVDGTNLSGWAISTNNSGPPQYSNTYKRTNSTRSAKCSYGYQLSTFGIKPDVGMENVYIDAWYLYDPADTASRNHKLFRLYPKGDYGQPNLYFNIYCRGSLHGLVGADGVPSETTHTAFIRDGWNWEDHIVRQWVHIQGYFEASSTTDDDGEVNLWVDGDLIVQSTSFRTRSEINPLLWNSVWFGNYLGKDGAGSCPASPDSSFTFWEDVYVDSTRAHIEVGNASDYSSCTHREIQIPSIWTSNSITINANQGSFPNGTDVWIFVINSNGSVSNGHPVSIGAETPADNTPPADVNTLTIGLTTQTSMTLDWIAVGDDNNSGTASFYDLRYSTSEITPGNWTSATQVTAEPAPQLVGEVESYTVADLSPSTTYYFAVKVGDEIPNWNSLSNIANNTTLTASDTTPPDEVNTLDTVDRTLNSATLTWIAVGDDGNSGTASLYDLRYSTSTITTGNWPTAYGISGEPEPNTAGQADSMTVTGLDTGTTYYFALKVADEVFNWTGLSNIVQLTTDDTPPVAEFSGTALTDPAPLTVHFTDLSSNRPDSWSWDFGDGNSSTLENPTNIYLDPGNYTVSLEVASNSGSDNETKESYILVTPPPGDSPVSTFTDFMSSTTSGRAPLAVDFTDLSPSSTSSWLWTFGDGGTSTDRNPSYMYNQPNTYTVTLTASNMGVTDTKTRDFYITVLAPLLSLAQDQPNPITANDDITFSIPREGHVRLELFSSDGRRVAVLVDEFRNSGQQTVKWEPAGNSNGMYFLRMFWNSNLITKKVTLVK
jgi:PKD repeat protein